MDWLIEASDEEVSAQMIVKTMGRQVQSKMATEPTADPSSNYKNNF